jgi:putative acetyltransferase
MNLVIEHVPAPTADARLLVDELETELSGPYPADQRHGYSIDRLFQPNIAFFIARLNVEAVGCGGIAFEDGFAELKRMYVRPTHRGRRVGQAILERLEEEARSRGVSLLTLETGDVLHPAIRMYERAGFRRCHAFGAYAAMRPHAVERSVFMEKRLAERRPQPEPAGG